MSRRVARERERFSPKETLLAAAFLAPSFIVFFVFAFMPFWRVMTWGTFESRQRGSSFESVGFSQYVDVLTGEEFRDGVWISLKYVLYTVPPGLVLGVLLAVAANRQIRGIKFFQTVFSSTIATSVAVASVIFLVLINPSIGVFKVNWLNDPGLALFGVSLSSIWQNIGLSFVIVLAGLQAIPEEVLEAATIDGYGPVRRFFRITLPLLAPVLMFLSVVLVVFAFQAYAQVDILTAGGPARSTETLVFKIFQRQSTENIPVGSIMSAGLFAITFVVTLIQFFILDRRVHYAN